MTRLISQKQKTANHNKQKQNSTLLNCFLSSLVASDPRTKQLSKSIESEKIAYGRNRGQRLFWRQRLERERIYGKANRPWKEVNQGRKRIGTKNKYLLKLSFCSIRSNITSNKASSLDVIALYWISSLIKTRKIETDLNRGTPGIIMEDFKASSSSQCSSYINCYFLFNKLFKYNGNSINQLFVSNAWDSKFFFRCFELIVNNLFGHQWFPQDLLHFSLTGNILI